MSYYLVSLWRSRTMMSLRGDCSLTVLRCGCAMFILFILNPCSCNYCLPVKILVPRLGGCALQEFMNEFGYLPVVNLLTIGSLC